MFKLKLWKFYYKLSYNLLPSYFDRYRDIIEQDPDNAYLEILFGTTCLQPKQTYLIILHFIQIQNSLTD